MVEKYVSKRKFESSIAHQITYDTINGCKTLLFFFSVPRDILVIQDRQQDIVSH